MYRAVVDTNLIVSGTITGEGAPYDLLEAWKKGGFVLVSSPEIVEEVKEVLGRPEKNFEITSREIDELVDVLTTKVFITEDRLRVKVVEDDPDDDKFIACAIEGSVGHIVTGDKHLLKIGEYKGIKIIRAREFLEKVLGLALAR